MADAGEQAGALARMEDAGIELGSPQVQEPDGDAATVVEFHFPVHVEVLAAADPEHVAASAADRALARLADQLGGA